MASDRPAVSTWMLYTYRHVQTHVGTHTLTHRHQLAHPPAPTHPHTRKRTHALERHTSRIAADDAVIGHNSLPPIKSFQTTNLSYTNRTTRAIPHTYGVQKCKPHSANNRHFPAAARGPVASFLSMHSVFSRRHLSTFSRRTSRN